ncbi:MAG: TIGR03960 family B12-binding radical SAM protein [Lachnospiraceae bacterium]|nr:TIGR03960 family B12-binding radical SAM protein [Lachnospiraceae bacterium]
MKKTALSDRILREVEKPARYIGKEINSVEKDPEQVDIRFAMCFPDVYEIGMSHLGIQIIYEQLNRLPYVWCERVYSPWPDLHRIMKEQRIPLFALESQEMVKGFDFLGITLQYELCYANILQILDLSGIPLHAKDRGEEDPIVLGGGPCAYNPEPLADFFDFFYIGESETVMEEVVRLRRDMKKAGRSRAEYLRELSHIPGMYVPSLYEVSYREDQTLAAFSPRYPDVPARVKRQVCMNLSEAPYPEKPLVPYIKVTQDRVVLEIQRGCIRGCRFCQAGMIYRPLREKSLDTLKKEAERMLEASGHEEISLSSLSSSDYSQLPELLDYLIKNFRSQSINISLPSLRIDNFSLEVMKQVQDVKKSSLTFAPEAGTQRLRDVINKGLAEEEILAGAGAAFRGGWNKVKLYFMLGLPTETKEDRKGIAHLAQGICDAYYEIPKKDRNGKCEITVSTSFFVPKPFTPFQWAPMYREGMYLDRAKEVKEEIRAMKNQKSIRYIWHDAKGTVLEGVLARGDRRLGPVIEYAYRHGALFDAWTDYFNMDIWMEAFAAAGVDHEFYTLRERDTEELLPWDFIDIGVSRRFMEREWERAREGVVTPNCREMCRGCGSRSFGGGVCFEERDDKGHSVNAWKSPELSTLPEREEDEA